MKTPNKLSAALKILVWFWLSMSQIAAFIAVNVSLLWIYHWLCVHPVEVSLSKALTLPSLSASGQTSQNKQFRSNGGIYFDLANVSTASFDNPRETGLKKFFFRSGILRGHIMSITEGFANTLHQDKWRWRMCWVFSVSITSRKRKSSLKEMKLYLESSLGRRMSRQTT